MSGRSRRERVLAPLRLGLATARITAASSALFVALQADRALHGKADDQARLDFYVRRWARELLDALRVDLVLVPMDAPALDVDRPFFPNENGARVVVCNHRSIVDIPLVLDLFGGELLARGDMATWPIMGRLAREAGTLFVDRTSPTSGAAALRKVGERLKLGRSIAIFPEGTTFPGDEVREFHAGAFLAAVKGRAPIQPVGLAYADESAIFGDEPIGPHLRRLAESPCTRVAVALGRPIETKGVRVADLRDLARKAVQELVLRARAAL